MTDRPSTGAGGAQLVSAALDDLRKTAVAGFGDRVAELDAYLGDLILGQPGLVDQEAAVRAAHKLAGSMGMFGSPQGSVVAKELELLLEAAPAPSPDELETMAGMVNRLQVEVDGWTSDPSASTEPGTPTPAGAEAETGEEEDRSARLVRSAVLGQRDPNQIRIALVNIGVSTLAAPVRLLLKAKGFTVVVIDLDADQPWSAQMAAASSRLEASNLVVVDCRHPDASGLVSTARASVTETAWVIGLVSAAASIEHRGRLTEAGADVLMHDSCGIEGVTAGVIQMVSPAEFEPVPVLNVVEADQDEVVEALNAVGLQARFVADDEIPALLDGQPQEAVLVGRRGPSGLAPEAMVRVVASNLRWSGCHTISADDRGWPATARALLSCLPFAPDELVLDVELMQALGVVGTGEGHRLNRTGQASLPGTAAPADGPGPRRAEPQPEPSKPYAAAEPAAGTNGTTSNGTTSNGTEDASDEGLSGRHVLVVEDDDVLGSLVVQLLAAEGATSETAITGPAAAELLQSADDVARFDLVLLDISLPGLDGFGVLRAMARAGTRGAVPVIVLSARAGEDEVGVAFELGAVDHVAKPFSPTVMVRRAAMAVRSAKVGAR